MSAAIVPTRAITLESYLRHIRLRESVSLVTMDLTDSYLRVLPAELRQRYEFREVRDAAAVMESTSPTEFGEMVKVLSGFALTKDDILTPGGGKGPLAVRLDKTLRELGWREGQYDRKIVSTLRRMPYRAGGERKAAEEETEVVSEGYKVDNVKGKVALDVEWNAKDGNLDRDLGAYRALYDVGIITVGVIVTRHYGEIRGWPSSLAGMRSAPRPRRTSRSWNRGSRAGTRVAAPSWQLRLLLAVTAGSASLIWSGPHRAFDRHACNVA